MFAVFGRLFSFVQADVDSKEQILQAHIERDAVAYASVRCMCAHETRETKTAHCTEPASGARTLLRLHRALLFIVELVKGIHTAPHEHANMCHIGQAAYDRTLALHHPWLMRKGVHLALHMLPHRQQFIRKLCNIHDDHAPDPDEQV